MLMSDTKLPNVLTLQPAVFEDERGFFFESFNHEAFVDRVGCAHNFVQDNHSRSLQGILRGLHYQIQQPQGKLVRVILGEVFDVAVDLHQSSPTFGQWVGYRLSAKNKTQVWIPPGFAHGFLVLSEVAEVLYKTTDYYAPQYERTLVWNDPDLAIAWPLLGKPVLSPKDQAGLRLKQAEVYP